MNNVAIGKAKIAGEQKIVEKITFCCKFTTLSMKGLSSSRGFFTVKYSVRFIGASG
jgi:hypothetical protein